MPRTTSRTVRSITEEDKPGPWVGPESWQGGAVAAWRDYPFHELPWSTLSKTGKRHGGIECAKASRSRRVFRVELEPGKAAGPKSVVYAKRYLVNNWRRRIGNRLAGSKAAREFDLGFELIEAAIPTPLPLAYARHRRPHRITGEEGSRVLPPASYLLTLEWPNEGSVKTWIKKQTPLPDRFWPVLARFMARSHQQGFYHDDCSAEHILVAPGGLGERTEADLDTNPPFAFIDVDNGRLFDEPVTLGRRMINLFQILRSMSFRVCTPDVRERFIEEYLDASGLTDRIRPSACRTRVDRIARRRIGRSVFEPGR